MAAPTYSTDLALIDDAQDSSSYSATGGGSSGLNDETDYFINGSQCISKNGFTATQKGIIHDDVTAPTIASGDAVFIWARQANRNILNTLANSGGAVIMGTSNSVFAGFNVDGNNVEGSDLLSWVSYAVDPTQTNDYTSGSPGAASTWDHFGFEWDILGSGSLKGAPNAVGVIRHGRELRAVDGDLGNGYATFTGMAAHDSDTTRRYGILTEATGTLLFHGALVLGQSGTSVDFRDSNVSITVREDPHVPVAFNEIEIQNASSNVEWTNIQIAHLGTTSPTTLTLNVGTFTGESCRFDGCAQTTFASTGACTLTTWANSDRINLNEADISGSSILTSSVAADEGAVFDDRTTTGATTLSEYDDCTFEQGTADHHAIRFGTGVDDNITLRGLNLNGFSSTDNVNGSTFRFDDTTGSINLTLEDCQVDGSPASSSNIGIDSAGITVTVVTGAVTATVTAKTDTGDPIQSARVHMRASDNTGLPYGDAVTISRTTTTATVTHTAHGLNTNDKVYLRGISDKTEDNGVQQITVTTANAYTFTTTDSGSTSYTGSGFIIDAQDETSYDNSPSTEGTFDGGTGHAVSDVITLRGGAEITVDAVSSGVVTQFTVSSRDSVGGRSAADVQDQISTTGSGTGFSLTLDTDNLVTEIRSTYVLLDGDTDVNGEISVTRVFGSNQPVAGWSRKSTSAPYYQQGGIIDTVSSTTGMDVDAVMVSDE